jgi:hypothetical protein
MLYHFYANHSAMALAGYLFLALNVALFAFGVGVSFTQSVKRALRHHHHLEADYGWHARG